MEVDALPAAPPAPPPPPQPLPPAAAPAAEGSGGSGDDAAAPAAPQQAPEPGALTEEQRAALEAQRALFKTQMETVLTLSKRHFELTGVDPLRGTKGKTSGTPKASAEAEQVLFAQFATRDVLSRDDFHAVARLAGCGEDAARFAFQSMRARARRYVTKHAPPEPATPPHGDARAAEDDADADVAAAAAAATAGASTDALPSQPLPPSPLEAVAAAVAADAPLYTQLSALTLPCGGIGLPGSAAAVVALMRAAQTPGLRAALADCVAASRQQFGVPIALADAGCVAPLAAWLDGAAASGHTTLLRKLLRAAAALPCASADAVGPLAKPMHRCRSYARADVAAEATRILADWQKAITGRGGPRGPPPAAAAAATSAPAGAATSAPAPFSGPPVSKAAATILGQRVTAPPAVAARSAADRLAGANERVALGARPLSADEIMRARNKKRALLGFSPPSTGAAAAGRGPAAPLPPELAKRLKLVAGGSAAAAAVAASAAAAPQQQQQQQQQQPADAAAARGAFAAAPEAAAPGREAGAWGAESTEASAQAGREAATQGVTYLLPSLVPDDPSAPLHVATEAAAAAALQPPRVPHVPTDAADAAQQAAALAAAGHAAAAAASAAGWQGS